MLPFLLFFLSRLHHASFSGVQVQSMFAWRREKRSRFVYIWSRDKRGGLPIEPLPAFVSLLETERRTEFTYFFHHNHTIRSVLWGRPCPSKEEMELHFRSIRVWHSLAFEEDCLTADLGGEREALAWDASCE